MAVLTLFFIFCQKTSIESISKSSLEVHSRPAHFNGLNLLNFFFFVVIAFFGISNASKRAPPFFGLGVLFLVSHSLSRFQGGVGPALPWSRPQLNACQHELAGVLLFHRPSTLDLSGRPTARLPSTPFPSIIYRSLLLAYLGLNFLSVLHRYGLTLWTRAQGSIVLMSAELTHPQLSTFTPTQGLNIQRL